ncbi:branched-chain amino acid ABC transporter permease [Rubrivivax benzoatilyticus]|uniref:Branched-chain amino acid ABC transporter permease n=1 Tax=Rubrivivax benzoatilyticus TaxID=316997 RepID=A0ABX0HTM4_9BURK|nr:branched-chain amino acid ABC transporter permease [Rubrivivax benzoatilyticus]EGJ10435.1 inner-membrane translocator [Rubrivivax benzoatilyticus JA2 = ATCC BAA-35]NHK98377.1 branched-chain amino acid ABC transporter permease [Rubrivivax benzoatilyticus]NHL23848.1 branched-chain amino acid ABC transporter permease [Rubrivivax benzoatilyticus]
MTGRRVRAALVWGAYALVLAGAPWLFDSSLALTLLSQIGIAIVACLAFNLLLGQGGMLSFGHAVYSGLGAYAAIHTLRWMVAGELALPVSLVPLVGGLGGLAGAATLGWLTTRTAGTPFAMITLGLGELVAAVALMFPTVFGGEGGLSADRVIGEPVWGISFGPAWQVYALIAVYCFVCTAAMYGFTRTPLGRMLNAVRDNPLRAEFVGYSARRVRYRAFLVSGFFMGVAGGLAALHFEIVSAEVLGSLRSGAYLLFTVLGGSGYFAGPILGAVLMVLAGVLLSALTRAWLLYLGLAFIAVVMLAPGGLAGALAGLTRAAAAGVLRRLWAGLAALVVLAVAALAGLAVIVELLYRRQLDAASGPALNFFGLQLSAESADAWVGAALLLATAAGLFELARRQLAPQWAREGAR